jgi:hypothetical protein
MMIDKSVLYLTDLVARHQTAKRRFGIGARQGSIPLSIPQTIPLSTLLKFGFGENILYLCNEITIDIIQHLD